MPSATQLAEALQFSFDESTHIYRKADGTIVPSVTQLIEAAGLSSYDGIPVHVLERKALIGTETHKAANLLDDGETFETLDLDPAVLPYATAYAKFLREHVIEWTLTEYRFTAERESLWYGGCLDRYGLLDGEPTVLDIKTSAQPAKHWRLQCTGYALGINHPEADRVALHLKPGGSYKLLEYGQPTDSEVFMSLVRLWWWKTL